MRLNMKKRLTETQHRALDRSHLDRVHTSYPIRRREEEGRTASVGGDILIEVDEKGVARPEGVVGR